VIAAIYCRKSTEQKDRAEEDKSVAQQRREALAYIEKQGWTLGPVFEDDGISGAEFEKRPGLVQLLDSLKPRPPFRVLVITDKDRLGRETLETGYILKRILEAGVRIFECKVGGGEVTITKPADKLMLTAGNFAGEEEREKARTRTHAKMSTKAKLGHALGGFVYGYATRGVFHSTALDPKTGQPLRLHVERYVVDEEAEVIRTIFDLYAKGLGTKKIANELNTKGTPSPRTRKGRHQSWAATSIREMLRRRLYTGHPVWNASRKRNDWGKLDPVKRPTVEQIKADYQPALRIVSDELWAAVEAKIQTNEKNALRKPDGRLLGRPPGGASNYLLTGMGTCQSCGGSIVVRNRGANSGRAIVYTCAYHWLRTWKDSEGNKRHACDNAAAFLMEAFDRQVLATVKDYLTPDAMETVIRKAVRRLQAEAPAVDRTALRKDLAKATTEVENYTRAIGAGGNIPELVKALAVATQRRDDLQARLDAQEGRQDPKDLLGKVETLRARLAEWQGFLGRNTTSARQALQKILDGKIVFEPPSDEGLVATGTLDLAPILSATHGVKRACREGESNPHALAGTRF
jgi:DNA invertase Pin-like site-specific DNA recombinase